MTRLANTKGASFGASGWTAQRQSAAMRREVLRAERGARSVAWRACVALVLGAAVALGACSDKSATEPDTPPPPAQVASVRIAPEAVQLQVGQSQQLTASPRDAQGNTLSRPVTWRSSDNAIATVDASGKVQAVANGTATIYAASDNKEGTASVQIQAVAVGELELSRPGVVFNGIAALLSPDPQSVNVTAKNGVVDGLVIQITYGTGDPTGWLTATLSNATAPATLEIKAETGVLLPGSYTARVAVRSATKPEVVERAVDIMFVVKPGPQMDVVATDRHNCALDLNGLLYCWGYNQSRQLGVGSTAQYETRPVLLPGGQRFMSVSTGELHGCGITPDAKAYCWGTGFMGDGVSSGVGFTPKQVTGNHAWAQIAAGYRHTCALTVAGEAYCWGTNGGGQLGIGTRADQNQPTKVGGNNTFVAITAGEEHTCALTQTGEAYCWGRTAYGRVGQNVVSTDALLTPTKVPGTIQWKAIDAGRYHTCALTTAGEAYCWGYNGNAQLGDASRTTRTSPTPVATSRRFNTISAGHVHSCAVATDGSAQCWGYRSPGALGDGVEHGYAETPVNVAGSVTFKRITAGNAHSCAVATNDSVHCWGNNVNGAIGDGTTTNKWQPVWVQLD